MMNQPMVSKICMLLESELCEFNELLCMADMNDKTEFFYYQTSVSHIIFTFEMARYTSCWHVSPLSHIASFNFWTEK